LKNCDGHVQAFSGFVNVRRRFMGVLSLLLDISVLMPGSIGVLYVLLHKGVLVYISVSIWTIERLHWLGVRYCVAFDGGPVRAPSAI